MNVLQLGALALPLVGVPDATEAEGEWLGLDQEIQSLASNLNAANGVDIGGLLVAAYANDSDIDLSGFAVPFARLDLSGNVGDYGFNIITDFGEFYGGGFGALLEAYMTWSCGEAMEATLGTFKNPFSRAWSVDRGDLSFLDRAAPAYMGNMVRDTGIMLGGDQGAFNWAVAIQDGVDGDTDEYRISGRAEVDVMGDGVPSYDGGYGVGDGTGLRLGAGFTDDGGLTDGDAITIDAVMVMAPWTIALYVFDNGVAFGDNTPIVFAFTWMFNEDWEAGARYTDFDDAANSTLIEIALNWYQGSNDNKWQFGVFLFDDDFGDETVVGAQRVLTF
jgi:hypothetical protein